MIHQKHIRNPDPNANGASNSSKDRDRRVQIIAGICFVLAAALFLFGIYAGWWPAAE